MEFIDTALSSLPGFHVPTSDDISEIRHPFDATQNPSLQWQVNVQLELHDMQVDLGQIQDEASNRFA